MPEYVLISITTRLLSKLYMKKVWSTSGIARLFTKITAAQTDIALCYH